MNTSSYQLSETELDTLETILEELGERDDETPQWEFCEGFMAALACTQPPLTTPEAFEMLLFANVDADKLFSSVAQREQFTALWEKRYAQVQQALDAKIDGFDDERSYYPPMVDLRGLILDLPPTERTDIDMDDVPSFAEIWATGFLYVAESWPSRWQTPKSQEKAERFNAAIDAISALLAQDIGEPLEPQGDEDNAPLAVSKERMEQFAQALWAVYDLRALKAAQ